MDVYKCDDICSFAFLCCQCIGVLEGSHHEEKPAHTRSVIDATNYVWDKSSTFKRAIIGMALCCFMTGSLFAHPLKSCYNNNNNDSSESLLGCPLNMP